MKSPFRAGGARAGAARGDATGRARAKRARIPTRDGVRQAVSRSS